MHHYDYFERVPKIREKLIIVKHMVERGKAIALKATN